MKVIIVDESARAYWEAARGPIDRLAPCSRVRSASGATAAIEGLRSSSVPRSAIVDGVLHLLVGSADERRNSKHVSCRVCGGELPYGSFRRISPDIVIASPEYLFVRMAATLSLAELIRLGDELCGTYTVTPRDSAHTSREPLTSVRKLGAFADRAVRVPGAAKAKRALAHVVDRSNSPMETVLEMLLCLPCRMGGYGMPKPEMNRPIKLGKNESRLAGHGHYVCDLYWESSQFALEYYGREWHAGADNVAYDVRREGDLRHHGIDVLVVTFEQISTPHQVGILAMKVAHRLGERLRKPTQRCAEMRRRVHAELLPQFSTALRMREAGSSESLTFAPVEQNLGH